MQRVLLMQGGRIVADGSTAKLLTCARMSALFGREVQVEQRRGIWLPGKDCAVHLR